MRSLALLVLLGATALAQTPPALTAAEQTAQATEYVAKMRKMQARVSRLADQARRRKDIVQLNCVNDKLLQLRGHVAVADGALTQMKQPAVQSDTQARGHEHAKVMLTYQKALVLAQEAETCIGEELRYAGPTKIEVSIDPDLPQEDPTEPTAEDIDLERLERPPTASPF